MLQTVSEVIEKLGGSAEVAQLVGVGVAAVSMAKKRKHFPHSWRMKIWQETKRRDLQIAPKLIGMDEGFSPAAPAPSEASAA